MSRQKVQLFRPATRAWMTRARPGSIGRPCSSAQYIPSWEGTAEGRRAKITFQGVITVPSRRRRKPYVRRMNGLRGVLMGVSRMRSSRRRRMVGDAMSKVQERQAAQHEAEQDAERDAHGGPHRADRAASAVTTTSTAAGK